MWNVKEQLRTLRRTGSLEDAAAAKRRFQELVGIAAQHETNGLWRTVCRWWNEIEVLIVTGATTAKVEANNTAIKHLKRTGPGFVNSRNYTTRIMLRSAARTAAWKSTAQTKSPRTAESRLTAGRGRRGAPFCGSMPDARRAARTMQENRSTSSTTTHPSWFFDARGTEIISHPRPPIGTVYISLNCPARQPSTKS